MIEPTENQTMNFMSVLIKLGLNENEVCGIVSAIKSESMLIEMLDKMEENNFKLTPRQTMNICCQVIKEIL